ncbi:DUF4214 domain-containing protein [[Empedobacter] haloabium]|uniref:DUF4214 domain-containing protein n=1 Tax=[Empedobacter] haloabium TaxID=592317 RepID=A0ABZ1USL9_9BURK
MADDYPGDISTTGRLPIDGTVCGHIDSATDEDWFHLDLQPGAAYQFTATASDGSDPLIYVYGRTGGLPYIMYTNDHGYLNYMPSTTPYSWVDKDDYYLWVKSDHPVDYTVSLRRVADDHMNDESAAIALAVGSNIGAQIDFSGDEEYFRISATMGSTYRIKLSADGGALPAGTELKFPYQAGWADVSYSRDGGALYMDLKAGQTRDYYVRLDTDPREALLAPVRYHVSMTGQVRQLPPDDHGDTAPAIALPTGGSAAARLDYAGDSEYFSLNAVAGTTYKFRLTADNGALPSDVELWAATPVSSWPQPRSYMDGTTKVLEFIADKTGYFEVGVRANINTALPTPVPYHVSATAADVTAPRLSDATGSVDGVLKLSFSEPVQRGTGTIALVDKYSGQVVEAWDMSSKVVRADGKDILIDPGHVLLPGSYYARIDGTAVLDLSGNATDTPYLSQQIGLTRTADGGAVRPYYSLPNRPTDTGVVDGKIGDYTISRVGDTTIAQGPGQPLKFDHIGRLMFTQSDEVLVLTPTPAVSQAWRLYQAAFDRLPDKGGLGYWLYQQEHGMTLQGMATRFLASPEFTSKYGIGSSNADFVANLYHNVLHRDGEAAGLAYHIANLERGVSRADVLAGFSESPENQAAVAELIGHGFAYTPYG